MEKLRLGLSSCLLLGLTGCALVFPPFPEEHYIGVPCVYKDGTCHICRVAEWQLWPGVYWYFSPPWDYEFWHPWYWHAYQRFPTWLTYYGNGFANPHQQNEYTTYQIQPYIHTFDYLTPNPAIGLREPLNNGAGESILSTIVTPHYLATGL